MDDELVAVVHVKSKLATLNESSRYKN